MGLTSEQRAARRLAAALEPVVGQVYFSPEAHSNYESLGFDASPTTVRGVAMPDGPAYFTSRGSLLGQVPGSVVAAAFGVFNPEVVDVCVGLGWTRTDAATIRTARADGAVAQLRRILGPSPDGVELVAEALGRGAAAAAVAGRPLAAGVQALDVPDDPLAAAWHHGDLLREHRGDSHTASWIGQGLTATEIGLLTELYWGLPMRSYSRTRAWSEAQFDAAEASLRERGLLDGDGFSEAGRTLRERIEVTTDAQVQPVLDAIGDDLGAVCDLMEPWGAAIRDAHGYPASGPHDLAAR
ncbi:SCO6745 family protein [Dermatobacter hominis]|uniref:SCO6745 family protein n=1 Tax=Dermatobacter hominis TaxID=2884263 RepID=UPI001D0FA699|nr:hypothetical protein [Dermatobacter hominis]UDY37007.1 hypothetical protein LH044_05585 [Dermatobacter hominis]